MIKLSDIQVIPFTEIEVTTLPGEDLDKVKEEVKENAGKEEVIEEVKKKVEKKSGS